MSIHAISGKPGGGKSMYSMKMILEELLYGTRVIITNVGVNLPRLNEYLQKEYPSRSIDLHKRIRLIDEEEMGVFFTIRPIGSKGPRVLTKKEWEAGMTPDYSGITDQGVMYVLDEVHIKFNARQWMNTGQDVLFYLSQHRKLGDTVVWITQAINNVDKQFRSVTQDYTFIRNLSKERMSHFSLPSLFVRQTYTSPPSDNSTPMETGSFRMNVKGLASLYETAKGVGIHGRAGADTSEKKKGLPWYVGVIAVVLVVGLAYKFIPGMVANFFSPKGSVFDKNKTPLQQTTNTSILKPEGFLQVTNKPMLLHSNIPSVVSPQPTNEPLYVTGYDSLNGYYRIYLSDGNEILQVDSKLQQIHPTKGVKYDGKYIPYKKVEYGSGTLQSANVEIPTPQVTRRRRVVSPSGTVTLMEN